RAGRARRPGRRARRARRSREPDAAARDPAVPPGRALPGPLARHLHRRRRHRGRVHLPDRMKALLFGAVWINLASSVLLVGALFLLPRVGPNANATIGGWERWVAAWSRGLVLVAIVAGLVWLLARTAFFENRPAAALEPRALWRAALDTWPGLVWLARQGALVVLAALLWARGDVTGRRDWTAARCQALGRAGLALGLASGARPRAAV